MNFPLTLKLYIMECCSNKLSGSLLYFCALLFLIPAYTYTQDVGPIYLQIDYMKAKSPDYTTLESEIWKPVHNHRMKESTMLYWGLYSVKYPGGSNRVYDYATISAYSSIEPLEEDFSMVNDWLAAVHPDVGTKTILERTQKARDLVWSEVFEILSHAIPPRSTPGRFIVVNQMQVTPGREARYERMEKEIYRPAHKILIEEDMLVNWHLLRRFAPQGTKYGYNYLTMDVLTIYCKPLSPSQKKYGMRHILAKT